MMTYKALNGLGPQYLAEHLLPPRSTRIIHSSQEVRLRGLTPREARRERTRNWAFSAVAPPLWKSVPPEICLDPSLGVFKSKLKTWLFRQASPPVIIYFAILYYIMLLLLSYTVIVFMKLFL